jgi:hypothetical protein
MPLRLQYQQLTNKDLDDYYDGEAAAMGPGQMLDVMESFLRLTLLHKFGQQHWTCCCTKGFRNMVCHCSALFSALWDPEVLVPAGLSEFAIPNRKGKVFPTAFDVDKVMEKLEDTGPPQVWQPKIAGWPEPVTLPPAKKGKRGGEQKKKAKRDSDSDFEEVLVAKKGSRRKLDLHARASSQLVLYSSLSMFISQPT